MSSNRKVTSGPRMSERELMIVRYVVERLERVYRNAEGKAEYARNMDQVMRDIFGVKRFTKALEKARFSEGLMIDLMRRLDIKILWGIVRNREHYQMLATLVALDAEIVKLHKKRDKIRNLEPSDRPSGKYKKLCKELKRSEKTYSQCIKRIRDIFDIKKPGGSANHLLEFARDWKDRYDSDYDDFYFGNGDIFSDMDGGGFDSVDSMDAFIRESTRSKKSAGRNTRSSGGALGLFEDRGSDYEDPYEEDDGFENGRNEEDDEPMIRLGEVFEALREAGVIPPQAGTPKSPIYARKEPSGGVAQGMEAEDDEDPRLEILTQGMLTMQQALVNTQESVAKLTRIIADDAPFAEEDIPTSSRTPEAVMEDLMARQGVQFDGFEAKKVTTEEVTIQSVDPNRPSAGEPVPDPEEGQNPQE